MKRFFIIFGAIFALLLAAIVIAPFLIPNSVYKAQIEKAATTALQREVTLVGDARLSIFPVIAAKVDGITVANPEGFQDPLMIDAGELKANVRLWPLFSRRVEISEVTLSDATIRLERLADGRTNWEFGARDTTQPSPESEPEGSDSFATGIDRAGLSNSAIYYKDRQSGADYALTELNMSARLTALDQPFSSDGNGRLNGQAFDYDLRLETLADLFEALPVTLRADLDTDYGRVRYDGALTLADSPTVKGDFNISSETLGTVLSILGDQDLPIVAKELKSLAAKGTIEGPISTARLDLETLTLAATGLDLTYRGSLQLAETPTLDGSVDLNASAAQRLLKPGHPLIPTLALLGDVDLTAQVNGPATAPSLTGITLRQRGDALRTDYTGNFSLAGDQALTGDLDLQSSNPRRVLQTFGTTLPEGERLQSLSLKGRTTGSLMAPSLSNARLQMDDMTATGSLGADLRAERPRITADLTVDALDLTPFMGSKEASGAQPNFAEDWDDTPFDLGALKALNATITLNASQVKLDQITLNDALLKTRLDDGRLSAIFRRDDERPGFKAFQGNWFGDLTLDASRSTPTLQVEALADSIAAQEMLNALTGYKGLSGLGDVQLRLNSEGSSLKALINGLDGTFETDLNRGALQGINLAKMVRNASNLRELLQGGNLTVAGFRDAISPDAETDFSNLIGALSLTNGVASITDLQLQNPVVNVTGSGQINLAARTLDVRLTPKIKTNGSTATIGVSAIPIPVRVYGNWTNVQFGFDTSGLQSAIAAQARDEITGRIRDEVGGEVGNILGDIVGGTRPTPSQPSAPPPETTEPDESTTEETPAPATETETRPRTTEEIQDELERRAIQGVLGAIFGEDKQPEVEPEPTEDETTPSDPAPEN